MSENTKKKQTRTVLRWVGLVLVTLFLIGLATAAMCGMAFAVYVDRYINTDLDLDLDSIGLNFTSFVYYIDKNTGEPVQMEELYGRENRVWVNYSKIPEDLKNAFIAIEDARFRTHHGVDWKRTIGAVFSWTGLLPNFTGGGSTITQQLIKNITEDDDVTVQRKIREIFRALDVEKKYTKDMILEMYLNTIFLGQNCNGVQTAAQTYFGKDVSELSLAECASIAGITKYPYKYDPFRSEENNKERQELILDQMCEQGMISEEERDAAKAEKLVFRKEEREEEKTTPQSYFVDQVIEDVIADLMEQKGYSRDLASTLLYTGGLKIYATIDPDVQAKMDSIFKDEENFPDVKGTDGTLPEASMVIIEPHTGNVVAMYGGRGEKTGNRVLNRATRTYRSPGSAIKPLSVYAPALEKGLITPASAMDDVPINFTYNKNGWPKNYYRNGSNPNGSGYKGRMSIVQAVEISNNTIPAQLIDMMTPEYSYSFLTANLGVTTIIKSMTTTSGNILSDIAGPAALSLGGLTKGMSVLELTAAYTPFANDGIYNKPRTYTQVLDSSGTVILENEPETRVAMTEKTAASVRNLMENVVYGKVGGATGTKARIDGIRTAGKTGTTSDDVDRWFVGFTPYYVGSVWFGYDKQQTVRNVSGNPALNLWKKVMDLVHEDLPDADFEEPEDFVSVSFCRDSGGIATEWCKADPRGNRVITQLMSAEDKPKNVCTIHQPVNVDSVTGMLATPYCPTENLKQVGLMQVSRSFPIGGIYVDDQQYTIPAPYVPPALPDDPIIGGITTPEEPAEGAAPAAATGAYNQYCTVHAHEVQQPEEPENPFPPEGGEWPPVGPGGDSEDEPGGDTPVTPPTETDPGTEPGGQGWENDPILGGTIPT